MRTLKKDAEIRKRFAQDEGVQKAQKLSEREVYTGTASTLPGIATSKGHGIHDEGAFRTVST
jgi:hypothetical protein